jgi:hypothetical protein
MMDDIASMKEMPQRCPVTPESEDLDREIRVLLHGRRNRTYKIYFSIEQQSTGIGVVSIFHVRRWARKSVDANELEDLMDDQQEGTDQEQE